MKNTDKVLLTASIFSILLGSFLILKRKKTNYSIKNTEPISVDQNKLNSKKILSIGSEGEEVKILQTKLGSLIVDGKFGPKTKDRLLNILHVDKISLEQLSDYMLKIKPIETIKTKISFSDWKKMYQFDLLYLQLWARAITKNQQEFDYMLKTYNSQTGKVQTVPTTLNYLFGKS